MIKFLLQDFLGGSQRILQKNENAVYRVQISALVPGIFKLKKICKINVWLVELLETLIVTVTFPSQVDLL